MLSNLTFLVFFSLLFFQPYWNMVWSSPFQIITSVYFLWQELGPSVLAGLFTMIFLIPVNGFIAAKVKSFQIAQMKEKDKRVKHMNEILQGIKVQYILSVLKALENIISIEASSDNLVCIFFSITSATQKNKILPNFL